MMVLLKEVGLIRTPNKSGWEKGTVPVLLRGLRKKGTVPTGFVRRSKVNNIQ
jgi:hypothetical protein